jgi:hypothetical protein
MQATTTAVGLDVHARSTHAAAINAVTGEPRRSRFGGNIDEVVKWLTELPRPVRAAYEAGPTGFGLARSASTAGIDVLVAARSKTPRAKGDRVKTDRKDAEVLARLLLAGKLTYALRPAPSAVPATQPAPRLRPFQLARPAPRPRLIQSSRPPKKGIPAAPLRSPPARSASRHKDDWSTSNALIDVSGPSGSAAPKIAPIVPGCINSNETLVWPNPQTPGKYDLAADCRPEASASRGAL